MKLNEALGSVSEQNPQLEGYSFQDLLIRMCCEIWKLSSDKIVHVDVRSCALDFSAVEHTIATVVLCF